MVVEPAVLEALCTELERRVGLDALWLFGSAARGADTADSDVDLAALFARRPPAEELLALRGDLAAIAGGPVDLVDLDVASPVVAMQAMRHGRLLVDRAPSRRVAFVAGLPSRYEDLLRVRRPAEEALLRRIAGGRA